MAKSSFGREEACFPNLGGRLRIYWKKIEAGAKVVADYQAKIILSILYVLFAVPVGLVMWLTDDPLALRRPRQKGSYWHEKAGHDTGVRQARRQG